MRRVFFLHPVIGDDPFDAALADGQTLLPDFLGDDGGGTIPVQEATADDQFDGLLGAAVIGFGSRGLQDQALGAFLVKVSQDLVITLAGEVVFFGGFGRAETFALALDKHGQAAADLVIIGDDEGAAGAGEPELSIGKADIHRRESGAAGEACQIKYGGDNGL